MYLEGTNITGIAANQKSFWFYTSQFITILLAAILLYAGINKIIDPSALIENLSSLFKFLNENLLIIIAVILPLIEIGLGILLLASQYNTKVKRYRRKVNLTVAILFGVFLAYSIYGYAMGMSDDWGCFGNSLKSDFNMNMVTRNSLLFLSTILSYFFALLKKSK